MSLAAYCRPMEQLRKYRNFHQNLPRVHLGLNVSPKPGLQTPWQGKRLQKCQRLSLEGLSGLQGKAGGREEEIARLCNSICICRETLKEARWMGSYLRNGGAYSRNCCIRKADLQAKKQSDAPQTQGIHFEPS